MRNRQHEHVEAADQREAVFASIPDGIIVFDLKGKILWVNPAALRLFELTSKDLPQGASCHQLIRHLKIYDEDRRPISSKHWPISQTICGDIVSGAQEDTVVIRVPSGREMNVIISCAPVWDAQRHRSGTVCVIHDITARRQNELQIRKNHTSLLMLLQAIAHIPILVDRWSPETLFLLPRIMSLFGQPLVDAVGRVLECDLVLLVSLGTANRVYFIAFWGFTPEQERLRREHSGQFSSSDFLDETILARLSANEEVIIRPDRIHPPFLERFDLGPHAMLMVPILLGEQLAGALAITKAEAHGEYPPEEIELMKAAATLVALVTDSVQVLDNIEGAEVREFVLQETNQLINKFLNLAGHELRTPLTVMMGNIQFALRSLEALKRHATELSETRRKEIEQVRQPLEEASQGARIQEQIIRGMMGDVRIQAQRLAQRVKSCDLIELVREIVARRQQQAPERKIILDIRHAEGSLLILADADQIKQIVGIYLTHALTSSPDDQPVTVRVSVEGPMARVSVYSVPDQGTTSWLTLPIAKHATGE